MTQTMSCPTGYNLYLSATKTFMLRCSLLSGLFLMYVNSRKDAHRGV